MLRAAIILGCALALGLPAPAAEAQSDGGTIYIMRPEPHTAPAKTRAAKKKTRKARGSSNPVYPIPLPKPQAPRPVPRIEGAPHRTQVPPPLYVPETGRLLPNLPSTGSGAGGRETFQDRAARCAHQAGVYGPAAGDPGSYIRGCINQ
jgi:hypothetical protein